MDPEVSELVAQGWPCVAAAVGAYGTAVLTQAGDAGANATVSLGRRIVQRLWQREEDRPHLRRALDGLVDAPEDDDARAALRLEFRRALGEDRSLAEEVARLLADRPATGGTTLTALGDRSVVAPDNRGTIITGDHQAPGRGA